MRCIFLKRIAIIPLTIFVSLAFYAVGQKGKFTCLFYETDTSGSLASQMVEEIVLNDSFAVFQEISIKLEFYKSSGHLAARTDSIVSRDNMYKIYFWPGPIYHWTNLSLDVIPEEDYHKLRLSEKAFSQNPINQIYLYNLMDDILGHYENNGYPFARVYLDSTVIEGSTIQSRLALDKGPLIIIDSLVIKGDVKINPVYLYRKTGIFPSSRYQEKAIMGLTKVIEEIPFLDEIRPAEIEFFETSAEVFLYLKKNKANRFTGILGFLPNNQNNGKLQVTGEIDFLLLNSFKRGETIKFLWKKTESLSQNLDFNFAYPFLLSSPIGINYSLYIDKKDSSFLNVENEFAVDYFLGGQNTIEVFYLSRSSSSLSNSSVPDINDLSTKLGGIGLHLQNLDYSKNPRKGLGLETRFAYGKKKSSTYEIESENAIQTQFEGKIHVDWFIPLMSNFVGHISNTSAFINNSVIFENELLRLGGNSSLRGFDEESILASSYSLLNLELRYLFEKNSNLFVFWNGAFYKKETLTSSITDSPWGVGVGSAFQTKAGIFTISYALGKQFDNPIVLRNAKVHFGLVNYF